MRASAGSPPGGSTGGTILETVAELKGTITVRGRARAWVGSHLRLCHATGPGGYQLQALQPGGGATCWNALQIQGVTMNTEGMHQYRPSARVEIPCEAPPRQHGKTPSTPSPDELLLEGASDALGFFLAKLREVVKGLNKQRRRPAAAAPPLLAPEPKRAKPNGLAPLIGSMRPAKATTGTAGAASQQGLPGCGRSQCAESKATTGTAGAASQQGLPGCGRSQCAESTATKFMSPALMEAKPGLGSARQPGKRGGTDRPTVEKAATAPARPEEEKEKEVEEREAPRQAAARAPSQPTDPAPGVEPVPAAMRGGLANLGNTCYLNSVLQGLSGCASFVARVEALSRETQATDDGETELPLSAKLLPLLLPGRSAPSSTLLRQLKRAVSQRRAAFEGSAQHDAHELLCELLGRLEAEAAASRGAEAGSPAAANAEEDAEGAPTTACPVARSFGFRLRTTLCCDKCAHSSASAEPFSHLSLSLPPDPTAAPGESAGSRCARSPGNQRASSSGRPGSPRPLDARATEAAAAYDDADLVHVRTPPRPPRPPRQRGRSPASEALWVQSQELDEEEAQLAAAIAASLAPPPAPVPPPSTVQQLLDRFLVEEPREWACSACGHGRAVARQALLDPPEVLLLHLSRFEADQATGITHKRCTPVMIDSTLRLRHAPASCQAAPSSTYALQAIVTHHGPKCYSGHYTCIERSSHGWTEYDDARVTPLDRRRVETALCGGCFLEAPRGSFWLE